jgi:phytoene dehydrogenase-like protein
MIPMRRRYQPSSPVSTKRRRVLVVGAGHNGLVCGLLLARAGLEVTVLEQLDTPGGCVRSVQDTLPGYVHDHCAGFFPVTRLSPVFRRLALERDGLEWVVPELAMVHPFEDGSAIGLHRDPAATAASLDASTPGAGSAWLALYELLTPHRELLVRAGLARFPPVVPAALLAARLRRESLELGRRLLGSAATLGRGELGGERAAAWLAGSSAHADLSPTASGTGAISMLLNLAGHWVGWPFPRGGAQRLTELMVGGIVSAGGEVRCGARVERVLRGGRGAAGVTLSGGEQLFADATVVTVSARPLAAMLDPDALPSRVMGRLRRWRYGLGTVKVDFALSGAVPWRAQEARSAAVVHLGGELSELIDASNAAERGEVPEALPLVIGQHSLFDSSRAPAGGHTLYAYARIASDTEHSDEELGVLLTRRIEQFAPGFTQLVLGSAVRSPRALELENPSLVGGDLAGGSMELDQQLLFRPAPELVRYRSPLRGLYVAGASVHPGPAVHGASGAHAAHAVLADASRWGTWRRRVRLV